MDWAVALLIGLGAGMFLFRRRAMGGGAAKLFTAVCVCLTPQGTITAVLTLALWMMVATIASRGSSRERAPQMDDPRPVRRRGDGDRGRRGELVHSLTVRNASDAQRTARPCAKQREEPQCFAR